MYTETLELLGLAKNEARIYETLLKEGVSSVGFISQKSQVHRRNVYDSLNRLLEKGLVFEIADSHENRYQAVDPKKLSELTEEKQRALEKIMPALEKLHETTPHKNEVYIYKGIEGWKNYMRDILRLEQDVYTIGGKGAWRDSRLTVFFEKFLKDAQKKNITFHILFDQEAKELLAHTGPMPGASAQFLPKEYSTETAIDIFGNRIVIFSNVKSGIIDDSSSLTVIVNQQIADSFRIWFLLLSKQSKK
ncbi:MAG: Transcriptional regulator, TrmB [uncultured bacterium]|uniref:Transcriptional regulator TrmB n=1 Tax=Candidatus Wolfebacteria bacterium GW2011_GWC2_39_22 TaxID=1619013 RepID=A0A0G0N7Y5_9BACT|nr:MAG: Transcriptional regulator, TrmB [uncultured bacterium]KKR12269.1 MAG: Transcriptional regulator TrmB [Candidatus Wolfebacteria bacterium GW2011_GWC2_39_22]HBI25901.1 hypothetical protein [Candidatus Wolfebacteria bacterium]